MSILDTLSNLVQQTGFANLTWGNYVMIAVALVFLYLAIAKDYEPLLLVPIAFGMLLVNIYPDIMLNPADSSNGTGGLLYYFYTLDKWSILPSLIFMGVGALTDFGPLIANPISFLMGAAAQLGIYVAYFLAILMGFNGKSAAAISIIGGADGPTSIFLATKLGQTSLLGPIAVAAAGHEALYIRKGQKDPHEPAPSGIQAREDPVPDRHHDRRLHDPSDNGSSGRYADARQPVP